MTRTRTGRAWFVLRVIAVGFVAAFSVMILCADLWRFIANRDYQYFTQAPYRLLVPIGVGLLVGLAGWVIMKLPAQAQRKLKLIGWGIANLAGLCWAVFFGYLAVVFFVLERDELRRMDAEVSGAAYVKYVPALIAIGLLSAVCISSWLLVRAIRSTPLPQSEHEAPE